jgi:predicted transcriptional regulator
MGVVQYHLYRLEKDRGIISRRGGLHKRFYPSLGLGPEERDILSVLSQETERDLVLHLLKNPGASQKELSEFAGISPASINWHMNRLAKTGLVEARREGPFVLYTVKSEPARILTLLKNYHPRIWERWSERLADLLS